MPVIDVQFRVSGGPLPADHGYHLFSAISHVVPQIHGDEGVGVFSISGMFTGNRRMQLTDRSQLTLRLDAERYGEVLPLAGKRLVVGDGTLQVVVPSTRTLSPGERLYSRLVVIKGFMDAEPFLEAARRQLAELGVSGAASLVPQERVVEANKGRSGGTRSPWLRRTLRIGEQEVVGFALRVDGLGGPDSLRLQEQGLGGRRRFGCGLFIVDRKRS